MTTSDYMLSEIAHALDELMEAELSSISTPVGEGRLDPVQWCLDTAQTRCIPLPVCIQHLRDNYGIDVAFCFGLDTKPTIH